MSGLSVGQVRDACAAQLAGLEAAGVHVYGGYPGQLAGPSAVVRRVRGPIVTEFDGARTTWLAVTVYVPWVDNGAAQDVVDALLSETGQLSILAALAQTDTTWGGVVRSVVAEEPPDEEGLVEISGLQYLSGSVPLTVVHP